MYLCWVLFLRSGLSVATGAIVVVDIITFIIFMIIFLIIIIFPFLEPFGSRLESFFDPETEANLIDRFVNDTLYRTTKANAELLSSLNKYVILGSSSGALSNIIPLNGFNIAPGSVTVTAGGTLLTEGLHYDVDYNLGQVRIRDESILQ